MFVALVESNRYTLTLVNVPNFAGVISYGFDGGILRFISYPHPQMARMTNMMMAFIGFIFRLFMIDVEVMSEAAAIFLS